MEFCTGLIGRLFWTSTVTNHRGTSNQHKIILICSPWIQTKLTHVNLNRFHLWLNLIEKYVLEDKLSHIIPWMLINTVSISAEDHRRKVLKRVLLTITLQGGTSRLWNELTIFLPRHEWALWLSLVKKPWARFTISYVIINSVERISGAADVFALTTAEYLFLIQHEVTPYHKLISVMGNNIPKFF